MKKGLIIRHVPVEGIAGFREPVEAAGYVLDRIDVTDPVFASLDLSEPDGANTNIYALTDTGNLLRLQFTPPDGAGDRAAAVPAA